MFVAASAAMLLAEQERDTVLRMHQDQQYGQAGLEQVRSTMFVSRYDQCRVGKLVTGSSNLYAVSGNASSR